MISVPTLKAVGSIKKRQRGSNGTRCAFRGSCGKDDVPEELASGLRHSSIVFEPWADPYRVVGEACPVIRGFHSPAANSTAPLLTFHPSGCQHAKQVSPRGRGGS